VKLIRKKVVSDNVERPTVFLVFDTNVSGFPTGAHVSCKFTDGKAMTIRPYTPTRFSPSECELMIRVYPDGKMTQYMHKMKVGDYIEMRGPTGFKRYGHKGPGVMSKLLKSKEHHQEGIEHIMMFAGGTGITPMLQICNHIIQDEKDNTKASLLVANSTPEDVMLYDELLKLESRSGGHIRVFFTVSRPSEDWKHRRGRVDEKMIKDLFPVPSSKVAVAVCGPSGFEKAVVERLVNVGHDKSRIWRW